VAAPETPTFSKDTCSFQTRTADCSDIWSVGMPSPGILQSLRLLAYLSAKLKMFGSGWRLREKGTNGRAQTSDDDNHQAQSRTPAHHFITIRMPGPQTFQFHLPCTKCGQTTTEPIHRRLQQTTDSGPGANRCTLQVKMRYEGGGRGLGKENW